jgi:hypothetical protein
LSLTRIAPLAAVRLLLSRDSTLETGDWRLATGPVFALPPLATVVDELVRME